MEKDERISCSLPVGLLVYRHGCPGCPARGWDSKGELRDSYDENDSKR